MKLILRLIVNAVAIYIAVALLNGHYLTLETSGWVDYLWLAVIFSVMNSLIKPVLAVLGCPFVILTLGLGTLLINALMFYLTFVIGQALHVGFTSMTFLGALFGSIIVSVVSLVLNTLLRDKK
jgi:putative membrane protein